MSQDYNATLNLPKTDFPMRAGLPKREPEMLKRWKEEPAPVEEAAPVQEKLPDMDETVRAIENSAAKLQADSAVSIDLPEEVTDYRPKKKKLENTQPFTI